jgi:lipoprotein-releasing system permease protein
LVVRQQFSSPIGQFAKPCYFYNPKTVSLYLPGFIARRVATTRQKSFSGFITRLSVVATALSVATMIVALAIIYGFQDTVSQKVFSFWGHVRVKSFDAGKSAVAEESFIFKNDTVERTIKRNPHVQSVNAFATKSAIVTTKKEFTGMLMKGIEKDFDNRAFKSFLVEGRWINFPDSGFSKEVLISTTAAKQLKAKVGDKLFLYFMSEEEGKARPKDVKIAGIFKTDIEEYDKGFFIGDLNLIRDLNFWEANQIGGYEIILDNYENAPQVSQAINNDIDFKWQSRTTQQEYPNIFDWLALLDTNKYILLGVMGLVAIINMVTCLIILVLERIRMIGVLKALGQPSGQIQQVFIWHTLIVAVTGILLGAIIGVGLCWLQQQTGFVSLPSAEAYSISKVPIKLLWWHLPLVCFGTLALCALMLVVPAFIIRNIKPVKAIAYR